MAGPQLSAAAPTAHMTPPPTHPSANPGYGKRSTPGQQPAAPGDFAHLPDREAGIALYLDRLPDGADISVKTLATILPYGQCALRTALQCLRRTGHLRTGREHVRGSGSARWVTRTWFSRTPRDNEWWAAFAAGDLPSLSAAPTPRPTRSRAYILLAALRHTAPALALSAIDCVALEPLAAEWFVREATEQDMVRALASGLPPEVHCPVAFTRARLINKLPPEPVRLPKPALRVIECAKCGAPGRPEALPNGECAPCRGEPTPVRPQPRAPLPPGTVHARAAEARAAATRPPEGTDACTQRISRS
ncbi:hypothetical protein [Streptomyces sp. NBC_01506]|uniref:hypothetical protein n=1 Tax=Streptomyces sp. NBC_01506 TaxID=2903887 RepID=UPI003867DC58